MTIIRKIVTSKIDGNDADSTDTTEIRPFGETAFYLDNNNKLTLMMFDGVRNHQDSKVLSPGVLYGSNADAGDGSNADTIKLIPDADLFANGSNQYIVVDPTGGEPGHIHLRAGGTQDSSTADLYLGGELTHVRVSDTSGFVTIRTTNIGDPNIAMDWTFNTDGNLYFPGIGNNRIGESEPGLVVSSDNSVVLQSNNNGISNEWFFNTDGSLTFPDLTTQTTAAGFYVAGDDSTARFISAGETLQIVGAGGATVTTDAEGKITVTAGGGGGGGDTATKLTLTQSPFLTDYWVGDWVFFKKEADGNQVDVIDTGLTIARDATFPIYNSAAEESYVGGSPAGTEWNADGWQDLSNVTRRSYQLFDVINESSFGAVIDQELVMHDTINNKYYAIKFHTWVDDGNIPGGAFSYSRRQINTAVFFYRGPSNADVSGNYATIDTGLALARGSGGAIYNPLHPTTPESSWTNDVSPAGTLWNSQGWGDLSDVTTRQYTTFYQQLKEAVGVLILNPEFVMYDTINNKYYAVKFTHWGVKGTASPILYNWPEYGFSYRQINTATSSSGLKFADGTIQQTAYNEQRLGYLPRIEATNPGGDNWLGPDDIGKFIHIKTANTSVYVGNNMWQNFPVGSVITIVNMSTGDAFVQNNGGLGESLRIWGAGTGEAAGSRWRIPGNGNIATLMLIDKGYETNNNSRYSDWLLSGPGIQRVN